MKKILVLIFLLLLVTGVSLLGGLWTRTSVNDWYLTLVKAPWNPPAWVFAPVWTFLYIAMAIATWRVWLKLEAQGQKLWPYGLFLGQLGLNLAWSWLFFKLKRPDLALIDIFALVVVLGFLVKTYFKIDRPAGFLMGLYLTWVIYAFTLNAAIVYLN